MLLKKLITPLQMQLHRRNRKRRIISCIKKKHNIISQNFLIEQQCEHEPISN